MAASRGAASRTPKWLPWSVLLLAAGVGAWLIAGTRGRESAVPEGEDSAEVSPAVSGDGPILAGREEPLPATALFAGKFDGAIRCVVLDPSGRPAAGIAVSARRSGPAWSPQDPSTWGGIPTAESLRRAIAELDAPKVGEGKPDATATSDAEGKALLSISEPGNYQIRAQPEPPLWGSIMPASVNAAYPKPGVVLKLGLGKVFKGRVVDAKDQPLSAVVSGTFTSGTDLPTSITLSTKFLSVSNTATDKATGEFVWPSVPDGKGLINVRVPGRMFSVMVVTPREDVFVIRVPPGGVVMGKVTDATGAPVSGADLAVATGAQVGAGPDASKGASSRGKSGPDGTYRIVDVVPGRLTGVSALAEGFLEKRESTPLAKWSGAEVKVGVEVVVDVVLGHGGAIAGRVSDPTGKPVPDADVLVLVAQDRWGERTQSSTTDAQGRFRFDNVPLGRYVLVARSATHYMAAFAVDPVTSLDPGASSLDAPLVVVSRGGETVTRDIEMRPGLSVRGHVVGPDKAPVAGATIHALNYGTQQMVWRWQVSWQGGPDALATSAQDGSFSIANLPPRNAWNLQAVKPPLASVPGDPVMLAVGKPEPDVTLRMELGATLAGRVLDVDGQPLAGQTIRWYANQANGGGGYGDARTEPDGTFRMTGITPGGVTLNAWGSSNENITLQVDPPLKAGEVREGLELRGKRTVKVSGTVVDPEGKPVAGRTVVGQGTGNNKNMVQATTDEEGLFTLTGLPEGTVRVAALGDEEESYRMPRGAITTQAPTEGLKLVAKARIATVLFGRIALSDGTPVPLCTLRAGTLDSSRYAGGGLGTGEIVGGEFRQEFKGSPPISLTVWYARGSMGETLNVRPTTVEVTDASAEVVITLEPGLEIRGRVVDAKEQGVEGVAIRCDMGSAITDPSGVFRLRGLGEGEITLNVTAPRRFAPPPAVRATPGQSELVIHVKTGASIAGKVLGPDGAPRSNVNVQVMSGSRGYAQAAADGTFRIEGLPEEGLVDLSAIPWGPSGEQNLRQARIKGVPIGTEDVVIRLEVGVSISGVVLDADGKPAEDIDVNAQGEDMNSSIAQLGAEGRFELKGLGPQAYTLTVTRRNTGVSLGAPVRVEAPATNVRLNLAARAKIHGRIEAQRTQGFSVWVMPSSADDVPPVATGRIGADSTFTLDVPGDGSYTVRVFKMDDDRFAQVKEVRPGADLLVKLETGLSIEGVVEDGSGKTLAGVWIGASAPGWSTSAQSGTDGTFRVRGLPRGKYTLTLSWVDTMYKVPEPEEAGATGQRVKYLGGNR